MFNKKMGDELVVDIVAVKCVQYFRKNGHGYKLLVHEIEFV